MRKFFSFLMAVLFVGSMYAADVTDTIAMKGFAGLTASSYQNQTKSGTSAKGVGMVAYAFNPTSGQVRGNKTTIAGASVTEDDANKNWSLYNSAAMPGAIKAIKVTQTATGTNKFQNTLYVSLGTATQGDVTTVASAQAQDDGATENEINFTIDANKKYTYFKLLTNTKFTGGSVADVKVMVTYEAAAPEPTTKTVYCKMTYSWWTDGSAAVGAYAWKEGGEANAEWPGVKMSAVEGQMGVWTIDLDTTKYDKVIFTRLKGDGTEYWGAKTDDQLIPSDDKDLFTITSSEAQWDNDGKKAAGTWSKYVPETPAKFYIVGDSALVTDAGFAGKAWNPDAIKSETDTFTMNLKAGVDYQLKITTDGTWGTVKGYNKLTKVAAGLKDLDGDNHNIGFKLNEAGEVKVVYTDKVFELIGDFYVPTPHYYVAGTMTNWKDEMVELLPLEEKTDSFGVSINLKADYYYQFKLVYVLDNDTSWYGLDGDATMVYGNSTGWYIYKSEGEKNQKNVGLQTTKAGAYKFIFEKKENFIVSVVIPEGGSVVPEQATGMLDGFFSVSKDAKVQFSRGNLQYNVGAQKWYFAEKQYDLLGEDPNLNFGDENYKGALDLFSWSNSKSNYGLLVSNKDADYLEGGEFKDWGALFAEEDWSTISRSEWNYILGRKDAKNNKLWTIIALVPAAGDTINGLVLFPDNWDVTTASDILYGFFDLDNETDLTKNTIELAKWETLETAGAVFLPMAGSRAGHIGCTNKGHEETAVKNPKCGWYCWVDNVNWYGYYWTNEMHAVNDTMAYYLIFPGWSEGPTLADEDDEWTAPVVWSREKRRGNSVRLVHKTYAPHYYVAGTMTNWKDEMVELLPLEEKADSLGISLALKADSLYAYKVVRAQGPDTTWYGLDGEATMEYGNSTGWYIYKSEGEKNQKNVGLQTTKEGDYPVTLVIKEDQLIVSVVIPKPDTKYYAKYADKAGEWNWKLLTEKEGKWLTDTIVYYGGGMNIHSAAEGDGKYFAEIAGVAAKDTAYFSFNPEDSTLVATVVGKYIAPIAEDGYYLLGTFNDWTPSAAYMFVANEQKPGEFVLTATLAVDDEFKVVKCEGVNWTWYPAEGDNFVVMACYAGEKTMYFNPIVQDGWSLLGGHLYMEYTFKPGYYLVGSMTSWLPKEQYWFGDYMLSAEYQIETVLEEGWQIKVAKLENNGEVYEYFPDGEGTHYTVDAAHAGAVIVYFRNLGNVEWAAFGGYIYIQPKSPTDIENTTVDGAAVKILRNGQILIIKGEKTYNAQGQLVE